MTHGVAVASAACFFVLAGSALAAERLATITVEAGQHERVDAPVSIAIDGLGTGPLGLREIRGGKKVEVASQVAAGTPPQLCWILSGKTPAGASRTFEVRPIAHRQGGAPAVEITNTDACLDVAIGGKTVLRYHTAMVTPPDGIAKSYARNAYIHPAWTPSGAIVTDDFPSDHKHQRGIWFSWTKTEFEGRHPDWWNMKQAAIRFTKMGPTAAGAVFASFQPHHAHLDLGAPGGGKTVLNEVWLIRVWNVGGPKAGHWLWDMVSTQRCASDSPLKLPKYFYGGQGFRGSRQWAKEVDMRTSEGKTRKDGNESKARWFDVSGLVDGKRAGCLIMIHPTNFRYPQPLRLNPKNPQTCIAPSQEGPWEIKPGADYVSRYRFCIHDGRMTDATAERLWADFAEPPVVKVSW